MSSGEFADWTLFEQVNGPLLIHERIDVGLAQIGFILAKLLGKGNAKPRDFLPSWYRPARTQMMSAEQIEAVFRGWAEGNGGDPSRRSAR